MRILRQSPLEENNNEEMLTNRKGYDFPMRTHSRTQCAQCVKGSGNRERVAESEKSIFIVGMILLWV